MELMRGAGAGRSGLQPQRHSGVAHFIALRTSAAHPASIARHSECLRHKRHWAGMSSRWAMLCRLSSLGWRRPVSQWPHVAVETPTPDAAAEIFMPRSVRKCLRKEPNSISRFTPPESSTLRPFQLQTLLHVPLQPVLRHVEKLHEAFDQERIRFLSWTVAPHPLAGGDRGLASHGAHCLQALWR